MIHGLGFFYNTEPNIGWKSFLDIGTSPWYKGPINSSALSSYKTYCGIQSLERIPVEGNYGAGTALSHWDDGSAPNVSVNRRSFNGVYHPAPAYEIMTGFLNNSEYMTGLTAGALKDYGYNVNLVCPYIVAHPYTPLMPSTPTLFRLKCNCINDTSRILHTIYVEEPYISPPIIGYYVPIYFI
jgi:hypothetical protein